MKPDRFFYATAGAIFLVVTAIGFRHYILGGTHRDGSPVDPAILSVVVLLVASRLSLTAIWMNWAGNIVRL